MQITDHCFLIAGGASGLGAATARQLIAAGGRVVLADLDAAAGADCVAGLGDHARFVAADVTDAAQVQAAVDVAVNDFGALHGLINCAGVAPAERVLGRDGPHALEHFSRVININLVGSFNTLRLAAQAMNGNTPNADGERGVIINTASVAAFEGQIGQAAYSASKGGVVMLTKALAMEYASRQVRVNAVCPGGIKTPFIKNFKPMEGSDVTLMMRMMSIIGRYGQPSEVSSAIAFLGSDEASFITGEVMRVDGGATL